MLEDLPVPFPFHPRFVRYSVVSSGMANAAGLKSIYVCFVLV